MRKNLLILVVLLTSAMVSVQNGGTIIKKHESQLPQAGKGNVHVAYQGRVTDQVIYDFMEEQGIPGVMLAIVQAPYISRVVDCGVTDFMKGNLTTAKMLWPINPISQRRAAVTVMQLYERGKLDLSGPVGKCPGDVPGNWKPASILQLMQRSSGITDYRIQKDFDVFADHRPEQLTETVIALPLAFKPGTNVRQSATNFLLLTSIIEKADKMPYHDFAKKCQIDYSGLRQTSFREDLVRVKQEGVTTTGNVYQIFKKNRDCINPPEATTGYVEKDDRFVATLAISPMTLKGFSDTWASTENVSHRDIGLAGSVLIEKPENRDTVYKPTWLASGKVVPAMTGWQFYNHNGLMDIGDDVSGHSIFLSRFTDALEPVRVTLFINEEGVDLTNLGRRAAAAFDSARMDTGANGNLLYAYESQFSIDETMGRIEQALRAIGIPVFVRSDHGRSAEEVGLTPRPNQVIVFSSLKMSIELMQNNPSTPIRLPPKISVWGDENGSVWTTFPQMQVMAAEYGLEAEPVIGKT